MQLIKEKLLDLLGKEEDEGSHDENVVRATHCMEGFSSSGISPVVRAKQKGCDSLHTRPWFMSVTNPRPFLLSLFPEVYR